jgi:hypothetical protein
MPKKKRKVKRASTKPASSITHPPTVPRGGKWYDSLARNFPFNKLDKYQVLNLSFEAIALYFTVQFSSHSKNHLIDTMTWGFVVTMAFICLLWASRQ